MTKIRDASVSPLPVKDYLAPGGQTAGSDPLGSDVISPGLHGSEQVRPLVTGKLDPTAREINGLKATFPRLVPTPPPQG